MKCSKCQHENPEDANFCMECGQNFQKPVKTTPIDFNKPHSYTPKFLADKILTSRSAMEGERKRVTVLFTDVAGFTSMSEKLDPEEVHQIMDGCFKVLMDEIHNYQGTINQFTGDGVMALFGAPVAIENHAQNACQAALAIQNAIKPYSQELKKKFGLDFKMRIGLNSGPVIVGSIGDDLRMDYTAIGDTTNLAARMESTAKPGSILVSPITYKQVGQYFKFELLGKVTVKGKDEPVDAYTLLGRLKKTCSGYDRQIFSEMVGRDQDLTKLELQVIKAASGEGSVANVIGEAGIGKSRLIDELKNRDVAERVTFLEGRAIFIGKNLSFYPIINLLKNWANIKEEDTPATALNKLETAIKSICPENTNEILPFLATLMGMKLFGRHSERVRGIEGEALEKLIFKNVRDLLIKSTKLTPLVIVIEDLHWADTSSIELLESLFRLAETQRILFINVFRPNHPKTGDRIIKCVKENLPVYYVEINLQPLNEQMSEMLINNMLNIRGLQHSVVDQIILRSGGNPFFIEEVVRSFIDEGAVVKANGEFKVTEKMEQMVIPHTINDVLMARIDRLDENTRELIRIASVIGRSFFYRILTEVAKTVDGIDNRLTYLKQIELIRERKRMEELEYLFKHALAQEAAYESILHQKRKEIHLNVADSIEKIFIERLHEFYGILSYHYINAENWDKAEKYMLKAGEEALKSSASSEALHYYQRAIELYIRKHGDDVDNNTLAGMEENIADAFMNKGFYTEAVDYFDRSAIHRGEKINRTLIFVIPKLIINLSSILLHLYLPSIRRKKIPTEAENRIMQRTIKIGYALAMTDTKRCFVENVAAFKQALKYDISKSQAYFNGLTAGGTIFIISGISLRIARKFMDYSWKSIADNRRDLALYVYRNTEMIYNSFIGNWQGEIDEGSINEALKAGDFLLATGQLLYLVYGKIEVGAFTGCETIIEKLHRIYEDYNFEHAESDVYLLKAKISMKKRELHGAQNYADQAIRQANKTKWYGRVVESLGTKTRIEILSGNLDSARETIEEAETIIGQVGKESMFIDWYCVHVMGMFLYNLTMLEKATLTEKPDSFKKFRKTTLRSGQVALSYTRKKVALERTESFKLMGIYYWLTNKQKEALKWWSRSIKEGEILGTKIELSRTYFEVGKRLLELDSKYKNLNGITAEEYLEKARTLFEEMDLQWDLDELDKVMAAM